jgi:tripartite-type tricarboxylate transporter receptor subunit TctC
MDKRTFLKSMALPLVASAGDAFAQGHTVRVVTPLPAGSSLDSVARLLSQRMSKILGDTLIVDNRAGANGVIGTMDVVRAAPDGLTLLCASNSMLAANMAFVKDMPYDPRKNVAPIGGASLTNHVLMVKANSPIHSFADFIAFAKSRPGKVSIGYSTTNVQLQIATINKLAGTQLTPIPYKGTPATLSDVIGGVLDATLTDPGNALAQSKGGQLRALAISSLKRNPATPDWPAISETLPGFDFPSWNAFAGPVGLPKAAIDKLSAAIEQAQKQKDLVDQFAALGTVPLVMGPDQLKAFIDSETAKWVKLAREANIQPQ